MQQVKIEQRDKNLFEKLFKLSENKTDIKTEITAGTTTFMTMAYALIVHPLIMSASGMPIGAMTVVTALTAGIFSIFMGTYTNLPFALGPAMGSNAFFAYTLVASGLTTWQEGLGLVFVSGVIFLIMSFFGFREIVVKLLPKNLKIGIGAVVGIFLIQLGFGSAKLMDLSKGKIAIGNLKSPETILAIVGLFIIAALIVRKVKGAILIGILLVTILGIPLGITKVPTSLMSLPPSIADVSFKLDFSKVLSIKFLPIMFVFFVGDFFSTLGTLLGVSEKAGLLDKEGNLPNIQKPFLVDAIATIVGAVLGTTVVTTYVESASGVAEGGRTGLTSVTTGLIFLTALFFTPIALMIPAIATAPVLIIIGIMMLESLKGIEYGDFSESFPVFFMIATTAYTSSISNGVGVGIIAYVFLRVLIGKAKEIHIRLYILSAIMIYYFIR
ncbi:NCS2 family permease [uncultured Cetobacterium sp.]|uniref:NCS2 family permease n=1 Tax=uncultured Cetobacterium sp. TaxID=527638 RepID=UPI00261A1A7A|nr:NCS2 family permease [uncultured Cetobacterium sp.]